MKVMYLDSQAMCQFMYIHTLSIMSVEQHPPRGLLDTKGTSINYSRAGSRRIPPDYFAYTPLINRMTILYLKAAHAFATIRTLGTFASLSSPVG